jgi:hypothetical protein
VPLEALDALGWLMSSALSASASWSETISSVAFWKCAIRNSRKCWCRKLRQHAAVAAAVELALRIAHAISARPEHR